MRNSTRTKARLLNILKLGTLALCFALVFVAALSAVTSFVDAEKISEAATVGKGTLSQAILSGSNYSTYNIWNNFTPGGNQVSFTETYPLRSLPKVQSGDAANNQGFLYAQGGDISQENINSLYGSPRSDDDALYEFGIANDVDNKGRTTLSMGYKLPKTIAALLASPYAAAVTVQAKFDTVMFSANCGTGYGISIGAGSLTGEEMHTLFDRVGTNTIKYGQNASSREAKSLASPTITVPQGTDVISLGITGTWDPGWLNNNPRIVYVRSVQVSLTISTNTSNQNYVKPVYAAFDPQNTIPYRPNSNNTGTRTPWPLYVDGVESTLQNAVDTINDSGANLVSYTNQSQPGGSGYGESAWYKKLVLRIRAQHAVKSVTMSNANGVTLDVYAKIDKNGMANGNWSGGDQFNTSDGAARVVVRKEDVNIFVVTIFAYKNFTAKINFNTYNTSATLSYPIKVQGIDTTPTTNASASAALDSSNPNTMVADSIESLNGKDWMRSGSGFNAFLEFTDKEQFISGNAARLAVYYTVKRFDDLQALQENSEWPQITKDIISQGRYLPLVAGPSASSSTFKLTFSYNFDTGLATAVNRSTTAAPDSNEATGSGYYAFKFWVYDLAGNEGAQLDQTFYAKVDYDPPEYSVDLSYKPDSNPEEPITIRPDQNGKWSTGVTTLKLTLEKGFSISGNTFRFNDNDRNGAKDHFVTVDMDGNITHVDGQTVQGEAQLTLNHNMSTPVVITFKKDGASLVITFNDQIGSAYIDVDWQTAFTVYAGAWAVDRADTLNTSLAYVNEEWKYGGDNKVVIAIDRNLPEKTGLTADDQYMVDASKWNYDFDAVQRYWFTSSYTYTGAQTDFDDTNINAYGKDMRVNIGVKYIATRQDLTALKELDIEGKFKARQFDKDWFDSISYADGFASQTDRKRPSIDLVNTKNGGLRVLYVWSEDQAGNRADEVSLYYILADTHSYSAAASVNSDSKLANNTARVTLSKTKQVKRGDELTITITLSSGYVPFKLTASGEGDDSTLLLANYSGEIKWALAADGYGRDCFDGVKFVDFDAPLSVKVRYDDPESFAQMSNISYQFAHRQVVVSSLVKERVDYTRNPVDLTDILTFNPDTVRSEYNVAFLKDGQVMYEKADGNFTFVVSEAKLTNGKPTFFIPKNVGEYKIRVYLDKENTAYVDDEFTMNPEGEQTFNDVTFNIDQAVATITPDATTSVYGKKIELSFKVTYLVNSVPTEMQADERSQEGLTGSLKLDGADMATTLDVGQYAIVQDDTFEFTGGNYRVQFVVGIRHTVTPRQITVSTLDASKTYGDADPAGFPFAVAASQFEEEDGLQILKAIFVDLEFTTESKDDVNYYVCKLSNYISREAGESVATYNYVDDTAPFDGLDDNYSILLDVTSGHFSITKRTVTLDVSGQKTVLPMGSEFTPSEAKLTYALAADDVHLSDEISKIAHLALDDSYTNDDTSQDGYQHVYSYNIKLLSDGNDNITLQLSGDHTYLVYIADGKAVIISLKENADFGFVFGMEWDDNSLTYSKFHDLFDVVCQEIPDMSDIFDDIQWKVTLSEHTNVNDVYIGAGSYVVTLSEIKLMKGGSEAKDEHGSNYLAFANTFRIVVKPAVITVKPVVSKWDKIYGQEDSQYNISYEITQINGEEFTSESTFAGYDYSTIFNTLRGAFARARYFAGGEFRVIGARYDDATDKEGNILDPESAGEYYALYISNNFATSNNNFTVSADVEENKDKRFVIDPYSIELNVNDFVGRSKSYDNTTQVKYPDLRDAYDVSKLLTRSTDDATLSFDAEYLDAGDGKTRVETGIKFANLKLVGTKAHNYTITGIKVESRNTDGTPKLYRAEGDEVTDTTSISLTDTVYAVIYYINNNTFDERIVVFAGSIGLKKSDFIVSKAYDNAYTLDKSAITINDTTDEETGVGPRILVVNFADAILIVEESSDFSGRDVGDRYIVTISLFFPIGDISNFTIVNGDPEYPAFNDNSITIVGYSIGDQQGIKVTVANVTARITQRVLDATSFASIAAVDRDYNSKNNVNSRFELVDGALAVGDTLQSVGVSIKLEIEGDDVGVGTHKVTFSEGSAVDKNYAVLIDDESNENALNRAYSGDKQLSVNITPAKLMPNVTFGEREYDGTTTVKVTQAENYNEMPLTTLNFSEELQEELARLSVSGDITYALSAKGKEDPNVALDEDGNVLMHNVLVKGLSVQGDADILKNYVVYGERYSEENGYEQVGAVASGVAIADYEIVGGAALNKRSFAIQFNDINIQDHVYDGTPNAVVSANIPDDKMVEGDEQYFEIYVTGTFKDKQVGNNIIVVLSSVYLVVKQEYADQYGYLAGNYFLEPYSGSHTANIVPRPVAFEAELGTRVYNGTASVASANITYSLDGILPSEQNEYSVKMAGGANFIDPNVALDGDGNIIKKNGAIFEPTLSSNKGRNNYVLTFVSETMTDENYVAVKDVDGNWYYYDEAKAFVAASPENVRAYYYELPKASKFINAQDAEAVARAGENIIGRYTYGGQDYYAVKDSYESEVPDDMQTIPQATYFLSDGTIEQRQVTFDEASVNVINHEKFTKVFDGTTKFFGKVGEDYELSADSVRNVVEGDNISIDISKINAHFDSNLTTALYVLFEVNSITGDKDKTLNYKVAASATMRVPATITKREINAKLEDANMPYGSRVNFKPDVTYTLGGKELIVNSNYPYSFFIKFEDFCKLAFGDDIYVDGALVLEKVYQEELAPNTYKYDSDSDNFLAWAEGEPFEYFRIGFATLPTANIEFSEENPNAGTHADRYDFADMGSAANYAFVPEYTGDDVSSLIVVKKLLYVAADGKQYHKFYAEADPSVGIVYFDETGDINKGFVTGQTAQDVFTKGGVSIAPVVVWKILNDNGTLTDAAKYPVISTALGFDSRYVAWLQAPSNVDYESDILNYDVRFMTSLRVENRDGAKVVIPVYDSDYKGNPGMGSELFLELNSISGMSMIASSRTGTYTWDGKDKAAGFILGTQEGDRITIGVGIQQSEAIAAGEYSGYITVRRSVKIDANDTNNYYMEWTSQDEFTITINKADPGLTAASVTEAFTGKVKTYSLSNVTLTGLSYSSDYIKRADGKFFVLEKLVGKDENNKDKYEPVSEIKDAGKYRITVELNNTFATRNPNHERSKAEAFFTVTPARVNVTINEEGYKNVTSRGSKVVKLTARYEEGKTYNVSYSIVVNGSSQLDPEYIVSLSDTQCKFEREIDGPGIYPFSIVLSNAQKNAGNYLFDGCDGIIELTAMTVDNGKDSLTFLHKAGEDTDGVVANSLIVRRLVQATGNADDVNFYNKVAAYMPYIRRTYKLSSTPKLASVYRISLRYNTQTVGLDGNTVKISVEIPSDIKSMDDIVLYTSTKEGGLAKLTDYTVVNGKVEYSTDFLGALVFVDISGEEMPTWLVYTLIAGGSTLGAILLWTLVAFVIRKTKNKKLM